MSKPWNLIAKRVKKQWGHCSFAPLASPFSAGKRENGVALRSRQARCGRVGSSFRASRRGASHCPEDHRADDHRAN
ncbi:MAG: hypothetical protein WBQ39_18710 [Terriglobales bacterium]